MPINILVVDDSASMRSVIKKVIQIAGFDVDSVYEAGNGREALNVLKNTWVDVILSDIHMPEMDGIEMLRMLRQDELFATVPVIVITTEGRDEHIQEAFEAGAKGYLKKPFTPEQFKQTVVGIVGEEHVSAVEADLGGSDF